MGHTVREGEERRNRADVPDVLVTESVFAQSGAVRLVHFLGMQGDLYREVQHGALPRADVGLAVIDRYLVGDQRILGVDAQQRAVGNHAIVAVVGRARGDDDHLALGFRQPAVLQHQGVVVVEECAKLGRPVGQRQKDVGDEPGLSLHLDDPGANVVEQFVECGDRITTDGTV